MDWQSRTAPFLTSSPAICLTGCPSQLAGAPPLHALRATCHLRCLWSPCPQATVAWLLSRAYGLGNSCRQGQNCRGARPAACLPRLLQGRLAVTGPWQARRTGRRLGPLVLTEPSDSCQDDLPSSNPPDCAARGHRRRASESFTGVSACGCSRSEWRSWWHGLESLSGTPDRAGER